jgi:hypothetical protein
MKVARAVDGTKWNEGDPILGHYDVKIVSATGLDNPVRGIAHANEDPFLVRQAALVLFCYFALGMLVFMTNCKNKEGAPWTVLDNVYFIVVTTINEGYGDVQPNHKFCNNFTMVFACFYAFAGVMMLGSIVGWLMAKWLEIRASDAPIINGIQVVPQVPDDCIEKLQWLMLNWITILNPVYHLTKYLPNSIRPTAKAFSYWTLINIILVVYFTQPVFHSEQCCHRPLPTNETSLNLVDAIYFVSISCTIGLGDIHPKSPSARAFAIFWVPLAFIMTLKAWGSLAEFFLENQRSKMRKKNLNKKFDSKSILKLDENGSGAVDEITFVAHMLVRNQIVDNVQLADIRDRFRELDVTGDGFITSEDLVDPEA